MLGVEANGGAAQAYFLGDHLLGEALFEVEFDRAQPLLEGAAMARNFWRSAPRGGGGVPLLLYRFILWHADTFYHCSVNQFRVQIPLTIWSLAHRSTGWHDAEITGEADPLNAGKAIYRFYIDGVLGGSLSGAAAPSYNWLVLGSGLTTASPIAFDNVDVLVVPEPSALAFGFLGAAALLYRGRRRQGHS